MEYNYKNFKDKNNSNKVNGTSGRIKNVDLRNNRCSLLSSKGEKSVKISRLVLKIMNSSNVCITNPSALVNYNFKKFITADLEQYKNTLKKQNSKVNKSKFENNRIKHKEVIRNRKLKQRVLDEESNKMKNKIVNSGKELLYHGSDGGIRGNIKCNINKGLGDFGDGFYTGTNLKQAENRVANKKNGIIYAYTFDRSNCKIYEFNSIELWALFIGYNRNININITDKLKKKLDNINKHDVIIGYIADDKISKAYNDFLAGNITIDCLAACIRLVKYGKQVVFKNNKALQSLTKYGEYTMTKEMKKKGADWGRRVRENMEDNLEKYKLKYRGKGKYIEQIEGVGRDDKE